MKNLFLALLTVAIAFGASLPIRAQEGIWLNLNRANSNLLGDSVTSIAFDKDNSLWIAADQGVAKYNAPGWRFYDSMKYMPSNDIWDINAVNGSIFFGHRTGLTAYDGATWITYTEATSGLVNAPVLCLEHDNAKNLWIGTARGLGRFAADKSWTSYKRANTPAMPYDGIQSLANDGSNLWMSFIGTAGFVTFPGGNNTSAKFIKQDSIPGFPKGAVYIMCLAVDWDGNVWAGTKNNGVVRINSSGATVFSNSIPAIRNNNVHTIAINTCSRDIWIGTDVGAAMYDGTTWKEISKRTGYLPNDTVNTIELDQLGHIWLGTKGGITEYKPLPEQVSLTSPADAAIVHTDSVTCQWAWSCPSILKYWYEIADNANFTNSVIDTTSASLMQSASYTEGPLVNRKTYYWRIKAKNDAGWGPFSPTWSFTYIMPLPSKPTLLAPANGVMIRKDTVTCLWTMAIPHVQKYWYELSDNAAFSPSIVDTITSTAEGNTNHWNSNLLDNKTYYWRVKARNVEGWGPFSDEWSFTYNSSASVRSDEGLPTDLSIYPNPSLGAVTVRFSLPQHERYTLSIYDELGKNVITSIQGTADEEVCNVRLAIASLPSNAMYVVKLTTDKGSVTSLLQILR